jgi:hypothetical protein
MPGNVTKNERYITYWDRKVIQLVKKYGKTDPISRYQTTPKKLHTRTPDIAVPNIEKSDCHGILTPRSRVLLEKLTGSQLVKKFPAFYGTRQFITPFTSALHLSLS